MVRLCNSEVPLQNTTSLYILMHLEADLSTIAEFGEALQEAVSREVADSGIEPAEVFFEHMAARLESAGEIEMVERAGFEGTSGVKTIRVDGSGGDPRDSDGVLSVIICDFHGAGELVTVNAADTKRLFGHLVNFLVCCRQEDFRGSLRSGSPVSGLAETIALTWTTISKVKLILVTNAVYSARTDAVHAGLLNGVAVTYNVWDLSRFHRYELSGQAHEGLVIDFSSDYGGAVPALAASRHDNELESYLMVIPGTQLAEIYDKWGARLLESNVRSFLQARGKVNQGIRDTIKNEPGMFFSYNNGLSATAEEVTTEKSQEGLRIVSAKNLQIVNGGQTTASLHAAKRLSPVSLKNLHVQMKLTVVPPSRSEEIVPRISQNANSQNKVSAADFFSNHPFHVRIEEYSRKVLAPALEGSNRETHWFYERARGQYLVERSKCSDAEKRQFDISFPKEQFFAKTDLAKVEYSFRCKPETVSKGAQKNFAEFAKDTGEAWTKSNARFDETWYRRLIAKLIVFRYLEKAVPKQSWYPGGYRANIVTYAIAKLAADAEATGCIMDLDAVWKIQTVAESLGASLLKAAEAASIVLTEPILGIKNTTEWAKKQACWERLRQQQIEYGPLLRECLVEAEDARAAVREGRREAAFISGIEAQSKVVSAGHDFWTRLRAWGEGNGSFSSREISIIRACSAANGRIPSERQSIAALQILGQARGNGYRDENEAPRVRIGGWNRVH